MRFQAIELETGWQGAAQAAHRRESLLDLRVACDFKLPIARHADLDMVALFQMQRFDNGCRNPNR
jgi:hypothetical protein